MWAPPRCLRGQLFASARQWRRNATSDSQSVSQYTQHIFLIQLTLIAAILLFFVLLLSILVLFLVTTVVLPCGFFYYLPSVSYWTYFTDYFALLLVSIRFLERKL